MRWHERTLLTGAALLAVGCGQPETERAPTASHPTRQRDQALRPTSDEPYLGLGYDDAETAYLDSPGGTARVWWALSGRHAPPLEDVAPADGAPDYPQLVAEITDEVVARLERDGARLARPDDELATTLDDGGDGRFDVYLVDFGGGADGMVRRNVCGPDEDAAVPTCTAHMVIENDFAGYGYPSIEEAVSVLAAHEYFHAVQAAYVDELPAWYSEGTATWFQEHFDPTQSDFERLANGYFEDAGRSLLAPTQGPFDGFHYSCALLFYHLDLTLGPEVVFRSLERLSMGEGVLDALDGAIADVGQIDLAAAFERFAAWNYFTGSRAIEGAGYPRSSLWSQVPALELDATRGLNWDLRVDPLSARYGKLRVEAPTRVELRPVEGIAAQPSLLILQGPDDVTRLAPGEPIDLEARQVLEVAVVNPGPEADVAGRVAVRVLEDPAPAPEPDMGALADMNTLDMGASPEPDMGAPMSEPDMGADDGTDMPPIVIDAAGEGDTEDDDGCALARPSHPAGRGWVLLGILLLGWRARRGRER